MGHTPSRDQKQFAGEAVARSIIQICECWDAVVEAAWDRGYQVRSGEQSPSKSADPTDPTGNRAALVDVHPDRAEAWLSSARSNLATLLRLSSSEAPYRHTGPFYPPILKSALTRAAEEMAELWPANIAKLFGRIEKLGSEAMRHWPPTPKTGEVVGDVKVGERLNDIVLCTECKSQVIGGAGDPIARIDGKPYHRKPCYQTVWQRNARRSRTDVV